MSDFRKFLDEQLEDPELKAEWEIGRASCRERV